MRKSVLLWLLAACADTSTGTGLGRPPATTVVRPEAAPPLRIAEVFVADLEPANHFAELVVDADTTVDLAGAELCGFEACIPATCDDSAVSPGVRVTCDLGDLALTAAAGEVAVMVNDRALAYLAWGAAPSAFGSPWAVFALATRALEPGDFIPLPYPMPMGVAVRNEPPDAGCAAPSPGTAGDADASLCPQAAPALWITEILPASGAAGSWVELENTSDQTLDLAWARLCQIPACVVFAPGDTIAASSRLLVHLGRSGTDDASNLYFAAAAALRAGGEVVLLAPGDTDLAGDLESLQAYVRSGEGAASDVAPLAVNAGLWAETGGVIDSARAPRVEGESLSRNPGEDFAAAWNPAQPTPLAENPELSESTDLWESCSFPRPWQADEPSTLVVRLLSRAVAPLIAIKNQGTTAVDLTSVSLELDGIVRDLTDAVPSAGATGPEDEALTRVADTGVDEDDFVLGAASPGSASINGCDSVLISELVLDPQRDWGDASSPFDATPGSGDVDTSDQWVEIYNCTSDTVDLRAYTLELNDTWSSEVEINSDDVRIVGDPEKIAPGGTLVVGNPDRRVGVDLAAEVVLRNAEGRVVDRVLVGVTSLAAGHEVVLELQGTERCDPRRLCWRDAPALLATGEINLLDGDTLVSHLPWGSAGVRTNAAVDVGIWPLATCALSELGDGDRFELVFSGAMGRGVGDYELVE